MTLHGVDVSSYQPNWSPGSGDDFVFIKASEGTGYRNPERETQAQRARAAGLVVGWYHYQRPGNPTGQAAYFVQTSGIKDGDLLVCDWEYMSNGRAAIPCSEKDAFIREVQRLRPKCKVGLYCNTWWWKSIDTTSFCGDFLWIAAYGSSPGILHPYTFWQYSDKPIDQNYGYFASKAALKAWATSNLAPAPAPSGGNGRPVPVVPAKSGNWHGKLRLTKATKAYNSRGKYVATYPKGKVLSGHTAPKYAHKVGSHGRYFCTGHIPHRLWLPMDQHNLEHMNGKAV